MILNSTCHSARKFFHGRKVVVCILASVAQLVEQLTLNQLVCGSSPHRGTTPIPLFYNGIFHLLPLCGLAQNHASSIKRSIAHLRKGQKTGSGEAGRDAQAG